jgi:hypothetical protein
MGAPTAPTQNVRNLPKLDDTEQRLLYKLVATLTTGLGLGGVDIVSDTGSHSGDWQIFHALSDTVFISVTYRNGTSSGSMAGQTLKAGDRIYGNIINVVLASGSGELYRSSLG